MEKEKAVIESDESSRNILESHSMATACLLEFPAFGTNAVGAYSYMSHQKPERLKIFDCKILFSRESGNSIACG